MIAVRNKFTTCFIYLVKLGPLKVLPQFNFHARKVYRLFRGNYFLRNQLISTRNEQNILVITNLYVSFYKFQRTKKSVAITAGRGNYLILQLTVARCPIDGELEFYVRTAAVEWMLLFLRQYFVFPS